MIPSDQIICSIDTETTGVNTETDRIVTLSVYKRNAENEQSKHWTVNPGIPIPKSSYEIHGITDENVRDCPDFGKIANEFLDFIGSCPLVGFNIYAFDILIIMAELTRHGIDRVFPGEDVLIIDCGNIFKKKEPRTLEAAVQKYCGRKHEDAHSSLADAEATAAVLHGQLRQYEDLAAMSIQDLAKFSQHDDMVDFAGKLGKDSEGEIIYRIGKSRGVRVKDDPGMAYWMLDRDFPADTKNHLRRLLEEKEGAF